MIYFKDTLNILISLVWVINGFACKVLNLVPRHQEIVGEILSSNSAFFFIKLIGLGEMVIAVWILSGYKSKISTWVQIILVLTMNVIEFVKVPHLLLFGKANLVFALMFIALLLVNEYRLKPNTQTA